MKHAKRMIAVLLVLAGAAAAQTMSNTKIVTNVPFEFVINNHIVSAGQWVVEAASQDGMTLAIHNSNTKVNVYSTAFKEQLKRPASSYALVFSRYGDQYFLSGVKLEGSDLLYRLPLSKAEGELRAANLPVTEEIPAGH